MLFHIFDWIFITGPFLVWQFPFPGCVIRMLGMGLSHLVTGWVHPEEYILCVIIWNLLWSVGKCPRFGTVSLRLQKAKVPFPPVYNSPEQAAHSAGPQFYFSVLFSRQWVQGGENGSLMCISATWCVLHGHTAQYLAHGGHALFVDWIACCCMGAQGLVINTCWVLYLFIFNTWTLPQACKLDTFISNLLTEKHPRSKSDVPPFSIQCLGHPEILWLSWSFYHLLATCTWRVTNLLQNHIFLWSELPCCLGNILMFSGYSQSWKISDSSWYCFDDAWQWRLYF